MIAEFVKIWDEFKGEVEEKFEDSHPDYTSIVTEVVQMLANHSAQGFTYTNSRRNWRSYRHYVSAVVGDLTPEEIAEQAPRICLLKFPDNTCVSSEEWISTLVHDTENAE
jgi:hypothetical protein